MKYFKQRLSKEDVQTLSKEHIEAINDSMYLGEPEKGDVFYNFQTDTIHTVLSTENRPGTFAIITDHGEIEWGEGVFPLLDVGQLIDALYLENSVDIKNLPSGGWVVVFDDNVCYRLKITMV